MFRSSSHRQVLILAGAQALFQTASVAVMTVGGLAGMQIAPDPQWATAPIAAMFLGTAIAMAPSASLMTRFGRRAGFVLGAALGACGGLLATIGLWIGSLATLSIGTFLIGAYGGSAQFYRFAAAEVAEPAFRPKAISLVLAGGIVAAVAGPELGRLGGELLDTPFTGSFLGLAVIVVLAAMLLSAVRVPQVGSTSGDGAPPRKLHAIIAQPTYVVALFGAVTAYGVMILAMTATPIAMIHHHHDLWDASRVIQAHVLGMFAPSFVTGSVIARFGILPVMLVGVGVLGGHIGIALSGTGFHTFLGALLLLGIGWNFLYVGATTLLTQAYRSSERGRAQAANDLIIFAVGLMASLAAGLFLQLLGWQLLNAVLLPWLAVAACLILWLARRRWRAARAVGAPATEGAP